ncbi:hypothetical protein SMCF_1884 [Streptomyces coelicoflavus ZG0656]|nr:hypothetical protein SMCF_1884 [Streptomyces coelicoflavus ZG0656]MZE44911.1 hypothetical protein [Streptomyces sp. SID5477]
MSFRYPDFRSGQVLTGRDLAGVQFETVMKQSGTQRADNAPVRMDPELRFMLEPYSVYHAEFFVQYMTDSVALFKTSWLTPDGAMGLKRCQGLNYQSPGGVPGDNGNDDGQGYMRSSVHFFLTFVHYGFRSGNAQAWCEESGIIRTAGAGGELRFQWGQSMQSGFPTEVSAFSFARLAKIGDAPSGT